MSGYTQCHIWDSTDNPIIIAGNSSEYVAGGSKDNGFNNDYPPGTNIDIQWLNIDSPMSFTDCHIVQTVASITYRDPGLVEFIDYTIEPCAPDIGFVHFQGFLTAIGYNPGEFVFQGCTIINPVELLHLNGASLRFENNIVTIDNAFSHMIHYSNPDYEKSNTFFGNHITSSGSILGYDPHSRCGELIIGDNHQMPNVFINSNHSAISEFSNDSPCIGDNGSTNNVSIQVINSIFEGSPDHNIIDMRSEGSIEVENCSFSNGDNGIYVRDTDLTVNNCTESMI